MGLIDRLVAGLIKNATGVDTRRMVRRIGGKNILLAGGAALAGAAMAGRESTPDAGASAAPPPQGPRPAPPPSLPGRELATSTPLPPIPNGPGSPEPAPIAAPVAGTVPPLPVPAGAVPPPPPIPGTAPAPDETEQPLSPRLTYAIVRTLVAGAMADGTLDDAERTLIESNLEDSDLPPEQVARVRADMSDPPAPRDLAKMAENEDERATLYRFGVLIVRADGDTSPMEEGWLGRFAEALDLDEDSRAALDAS